MSQFDLNPKRQTDFVVIDNFYDNPQAVRDFALSLEFKADNRYFKGQRSNGKYLTDEMGKAFEVALQKTMTKWDYEVNGCFQFCTPEDSLVYHMDAQQWAATVYLTPNAPPECGTSFYRSKHTGIRSCPSRIVTESEMVKEMIDCTFQGGFYDKTQFELIDSIGNVFNRCVIWDAKMIHAASQYFGNHKHNARLFQMFFFDAE